MNSTAFLPQIGNYKKLLSYQKSRVIFDCTNLFCERFFHKPDRTVSQMVQAARSGKQNIIDSSEASILSTETELKLTKAARASLDELLEDYRDFIRVRQEQLWAPNSTEALFIRRMSSGKTRHSEHPGIDQTALHLIGTKPPSTCANIMICLINQCNYLLDRQIREQERRFPKSRGIRQLMYQARKRYRKMGVG